MSGLHVMGLACMHALIVIVFVKFNFLFTTALISIYCTIVGGGCTQGDIRLMNFYSNSYSRSEGRVEVCYNDEWGTVCNNYWSANDATVACKQLGYDGYFNYYSYSYYGQGTGSIWLNYLNCNGGESSLFDCPNSLGNQNCNHYYDVGVRCYCKLILSIVVLSCCCDYIIF